MLGVLNWNDANELYIHIHTCISHICTNVKYNIAMWVHISSYCNFGKCFQTKANLILPWIQIFRMESPIQSATSRSHSVLCLIQLGAAVLLPSNDCISDSGMDYSSNLHMPVNYSESMDSCHSQLSDKKFHMMLWSETVRTFEPEYAVLILTPSTLGKIGVNYKNLLHSRILPPCGGTCPIFFTVIKCWFSHWSFSLTPL